MKDITKIYIYNINGELEKILPALADYKETNKLENYFPSLKGREDYLISEIEILHPIIENNSIREATREERIIQGETELLLDGEYLYRGKIKEKGKPTNMLMPIWSKDKKLWEEKATLEDYMNFFDKSIEEHTQTIIKSKGYTDITRVNLWASIPNSFCKDEAEKIQAWYNDIWKKCLEIQTEVVNGKREIPSLEILIKELPTLE